ncbi:MAG: hypothetical protein AAGJ97_03510 [Planctomycetota bacterium]
MKFLIGLAGMAALAIVFAELFVVGLLYSRGQIEQELVDDIRRTITGEPEPEPVEDEAEDESRGPTWEEIVEERALALASLRTREEELAALKALLERQAEDFADARAAFDADVALFRSELTQLAATNASEATTRARGIVEVAPPETSVNYLMGLSKSDNVRIVTGLPAKTVTKILQEFARGTDQQRERGQEIFNALADGGAKTALIDAAEDRRIAAADDDT